ncbi:hypothetical protein FHS84_004007 [Rhizomicrobium electricum]|jgi:hypothetical protein|nr:hypothetical protein [Rhizomicrobium electricum]
MNADDGRFANKKPDELSVRRAFLQSRGGVSYGTSRAIHSGSAKAAAWMAGL